MISICIIFLFFASRKCRVMKWENVVSGYVDDDEGILYQLGVYGQLGEYSSSNVMGSRKFGCSWTVDDSIFIFGGYGYGKSGDLGDLSDMWQYNATLGMWRHVKGPDLPNQPSFNDAATEFNDFTVPPGQSFTSCWVEETESDGIVLSMHNGLQILNNLVSKSIHSFKVSTSQWKRRANWLYGYPYSSSFFVNQYFNVGPTFLNKHSGVYLKNRKRWISFGGCSTNCNYAPNDFWEFNTNSTDSYYEVWRWLYGSGTKMTVGDYSIPQCYSEENGVFSSNNVPYGTHSAIMWEVDEKYIYLFGGAFGTGRYRFHALWVLDYDILQMALLTSCGYNQESQIDDADWFNEGNRPKGRIGSLLWWGKNYDSIVITGGATKSYDILGDVWIYSIKRNMWRIYNDTVSVENEPTTSSFYGGRTGAFITQQSDSTLPLVFSGDGYTASDALMTFRDIWRFQDVIAECSNHGTFTFEQQNIWNHTGTGVEICTCDNPPYYRGDQCEIWDCFGIQNDNDEVCGGHGVCSDIDECTCNPYYSGSNCTEYDCFSISWRNADVCNGQGSCVSHDTCQCWNETYCSGEECKICLDWTCGGYDFADSIHTCSGHGTCVIQDTCDCDSGYWGVSIGSGYYDDCYLFNCFDILYNQTDVCSGNGDCISPDGCSCNSHHYGEKCNIIIQQGTYDFEKEEVSIPYQMPIALVQDMQEMFNCSEIIVNILDVMGTTDESLFYCQWKFSFSYTLRLMIYFYDPATFLPEDISGELKIIPHSGGVSSQFATMRLKKEERDVDSLTFGEFALYTFWVPILMLFCICFLCCCFICLACLIGCPSCFVYLKNRKYSALTNLDILLQEQRAGKEAGIAHLRINKALFEIDYKDIRLEKTIGKGGSGAQIYKASWKGQTVSFKVFKTKDLSDQENFDDFEKEVSLLSSLKHPSILTFYGCSFEHPRVGIVTEFCGNGDLKAFMLKKQASYGHGFLKTEQKIDIMLQIAEGMEYLHERKVIHRDLKSNNVLLTDHLYAKIIDFGLSRIFDENKSGTTDLTRQTGTSVYMAPEVTSGGQYNELCDVFSYAIILFEIMSENFSPYGEKNDFSIELKVANDPSFRPVINDELFENMDWYMNLTRRCWNHQPQKRPSFTEIISIIRKKTDKEKDVY